MVKAYPLYTPTGPVNDGPLTRKCNDPLQMKYSSACGDFAVNTVQPSSPPAAATGAKIPLIDDAKYPNIGDRMTAAGISWKWYSGGWREASAGAPGPLFQYHHQPFNYFANYAPGQPGRSHLKDERRFITAAKHGHLPTVSFVKPYGAENEHPGYASQSHGSDHLVDLLKTITNGPQAKDTLVVVTYDEFGGQWDHVSPPGAGAKKGTHDAWGPGTRIPALVIGRVAEALRASTTRRTTRRRSWRPSSAASASRRCRAGTARSTTSRTRSPGAAAADRSGRGTVTGCLRRTGPVVTSRSWPRSSPPPESSTW